MTDLIKPRLRNALAVTLEGRCGMKIDNEPGSSALRWKILKNGVERAISDPEYFTCYMRGLDGLLVRPLADDLRALLPDDQEEDVRVHGLGVLSPRDLENLALSPYQMSQIQRAVFEQEIPVYWLDSIDQAMGLSLEETDAPRRDINEVVNAAFTKAGLVRPRGLESPTVWVSHHRSQVVIEHIKGSYKQYCDPDDPRDDNYPMKGITYPTAKGGLPGYTGEDRKPLDAFVGENPCGQNGMFVVFRPDVRGQLETKFFFGFTPEERDQVLAAYTTVRMGKLVVFDNAEELEAALTVFRSS